MCIKQESRDLGLSSVSIVDMFPWVDLQVDFLLRSVLKCKDKGLN